jgi:hypothetical protein
MNNFLKLVFTGLIIGMSLIEMNAQTIKVGIVIVGDPKGETYRVESRSMRGESFKILKPPLMDYLYLGEGDSETMHRYAEEINLYVKKKLGLTYRKAHLIIPEGADRYLILSRDRSLKRGQYFSAEWSDKLPYPEKNNEYDELFKKDTAIHNLKTPDVSISYLGRPFSVEQIRGTNILPDQLLPLEFKLQSPHGFENTEVQFDAMEIMFVRNYKAVVRRLHAKGNYIISVNWPSDEFKLEPGSIIVINIAYSYTRNNEIIESAVMSRSLKF